MICKLVKNKLNNIQIFSLKEKKFIKCTQSLHFKLNTEGEKCNYKIKIGDKTFVCNGSVEIEYIRIFHFDEMNKRVTLDFLYESGSIKKMVSKHFNISHHIIPSVLSELSDIEDKIESYTKDEICGVLESLLNY